MQITIIDYGSGNLRSVSKAFEHVTNNFVMPAYVRASGSPLKAGMTVKVSSNPADLKAATHIVLPGVGAFGDCAAGLRAINGMEDALKEQVLAVQKPFLGICVGMQLLAETGNEYGSHRGLGWIKGTVDKIQTTNPIPHMGWNELNIKTPHPLTNGISGDLYFVHSYCFNATNEQNIIATTTYGAEITAIIANENIMGVQFHPEKSQKLGLKLITNFLSI